MGDELPVYVVDDDDAVRASLKALFTASGFAVRCFPSGDTFTAGQDELDRGVLILDWRMPGGNGAKVLANIGPRFCAIVHSAHVDEDLRAEAMEHGAVNVLEKPCDPRRLVQAVREAGRAHAGPRSSAAGQ